MGERTPERASRTRPISESERSRLEIDQDAFGKHLRSVVEQGPEHQIVERDDGFVSVGSMNYFGEYESWEKHERHAVELAFGRVLDIGCGAGRHALYLHQQRGLPVTAIDRSPLAVEICRARGVQDARLLGIEDVDRLGEGAADTVLLLGNNLGLLRSRDMAKALLPRLHAVTSPEGIVIGETLDPYRTDLPEHRAYHQMNRAEGRMGGQIRLRIRHRRMASPWFDYLMVSSEELADLVDGTGWRVDRHIDAEHGPRYIAVLSK